MAEGFNKFRMTLDRLNQNTVSNTEGILQMSRTFAASDRYLKYVVTKLNKRYAWTLALALFPISMERLSSFSHPLLLWNDAEKLLPESEAKEKLKAFAEFLIKRNK